MGPRVPDRQRGVPFSLPNDIAHGSARTMIEKVSCPTSLSTCLSVCLSVCPACLSWLSAASAVRLQHHLSLYKLINTATACVDNAEPKVAHSLPLPCVCPRACARPCGLLCCLFHASGLPSGATLRCHHRVLLLCAVVASDPRAEETDEKSHGRYATLCSLCCL